MKKLKKKNSKRNSKCKSNGKTCKMLETNKRYDREEISQERKN